MRSLVWVLGLFVALSTAACWSTTTKVGPFVKDVQLVDQPDGPELQVAKCSITYTHREGLLLNTSSADIDQRDCFEETVELPESEQ